MEIVNQPENELLAKWSHLLEWTDGIFTWTSPGELCRLAEYASQAEQICEIGSFHGKSALVMHLANTLAYILCIDLAESEEAFQKLSLNLQIPNERISLFRGTSLVLQTAVQLYDFAFIDGGHLFEDVRDDIARLLPAMKPGSVLSGHDWRPNDMNDGVNRGVLHHFKREQLTINESLWAVQL